jgi:hypothetical protein
MADRFYIGYVDGTSGLQTNYKPYAIADNAFSQLNNAYIFRGRVRKRFGSNWVNDADTSLESRFRILIDNTNGSGDINDYTPLDGAGNVIITPAIGQQFSIGTQTFTVNALGTPAAMLKSGAATLATFSTSGGLAGNVIIDGADHNTALYYYPNLPVMGLLTFVNSSSNIQTIIGFDTKYSYLYNNGWNYISGVKTDNTGANIWSGNNLNFFWGTSWVGTNNSDRVFFVTNNTDTDGIRVLNNSTNEWSFGNFYYATISLGVSTDGSGNRSTTVAPAFRSLGQIFVIGNTVFTVVTATGAMDVSSLNTSATVGTGTFNVSSGALVISGAQVNTVILYGASNKVNQALMCVVFKNRLLLLNTKENGVPYINRVRWSQIGSPLDPTAWLQPPGYSGRGNALDAATTEAIVSVEFIKDRLIVYFEHSTWELAYTNNQVQPFTWQKINTELGAESTYSTVPFDKVALCIDDVGIHACNGANVERIDDLIPEQVFNIHQDNDAPIRVYGIRDYDIEAVYWTFPGITDGNDADQPYPSRVLVYNYKTGTWAFNDDSITVFGYFQPSTGTTWSSTTTNWSDETPWSTGYTQAAQREVIAGNQQGYTFIVNTNEPTNAPVLQITNLVLDATGFGGTVTSIDHNLRVGDFVQFSSITGSGTITQLNTGIGKVTLYTDANTFNFALNLELYTTPLTGSYTGSGLMARVSKIDIYTKEFNFYVDKGRNAYVSKIDFMVDKTSAGQLMVNYYYSTNVDSPTGESEDTGNLLGTSTLDTFAYPTIPYEAASSRLWHPIYFDAEGEVVQFQIVSSDLQVQTPEISNCDFQLHALVVYAQPTTGRLQ